MSCNPAIGGLGKGHLVREIDALDGVMGRAADLAGIQFRVLNRRKGPAVQGPRAQADRKLYRRAMQALVAGTPNLTVVEGEAAKILSEAGAVSGIELADGRAIACPSVVLTTGTFLRGVIHLGEKRTPAGRFGDPPSLSLARSLDQAGFALGRLKTGTPPRLDGATIDWERLEIQNGDPEPEFFSAMTTEVTAPQLPCHITRTTPETHAIIRADAHRSAVYSGAISGRGPRYCPSIEDKVIRFADRESHQIFLEPEGVDDPTVYPNGISTSLPAETQAALVATSRASSARASSAPAMRSNTTMSTLAGSTRPLRRAALPVCSWLDRSTAPPATRRRRRRGSRPGSTPRAKRREGRSRPSTGPNPISAS